MTLSLIVAMSQNRVIGNNNRLPWHLSEDLKRFKQITMGHPIVMGRKTFESIGKPLPGRENIILTRDKNFMAMGVTVMHDVEKLLSWAKIPTQEVFVIGGAEIFKLVLPHAQKIYLTSIEKDFDGDAFFPAIDFKKDFSVVEKTAMMFSQQDNLPYRFLTLERLS